MSEDKYLILVVDDEPDMHALSRLSLKNLKYKGKGVQLDFASTGTEAVEFMQAHPETAVILLDVVMETTSAGLDACERIRGEIGNEFVRILLRTGQPGAAPEKKVIDGYDIDGYLAKAELTTNRLYTAVRSAIKTYSELLELQHHREILHFVHESVVNLQESESLESSLQQILETAVVIAPADLAVLHLGVYDSEGGLQEYLLSTGTEAEGRPLHTEAEQVLNAVNANPGALALQQAGHFLDGYLVPLHISQNWGQGWIYLSGHHEDPLTLQTLPMLAIHAANALYVHLLNHRHHMAESFYPPMII